MMYQLDLAFWAPDSVRRVLWDYVAARVEAGCSEETIDEDYRWRVAWLIEVLGEATSAAAVSFPVLERVARAARGVLRDVTIRKRMRFWRSACLYAAQRGVIRREAVPELPPWLRDDGRRCDDYYTLGQYPVFRMALPPGRFRHYSDLGFWTGMHRHDLFVARPEHFEPDYQWEGTVTRGRWLRHNHKNRKSSPTWIPMEPEFRPLAIEMLDVGALPIGSLNNLARTFHAAADRAELPRIRANLGLRASHSTLLAARGYTYEYIRQVLGHEGEVGVDAGRVVTAKRPSTLSRHYMRPSPDLLRPPRNM